jgi:DNA-binding response OmpR family regulator
MTGYGQDSDRKLASEAGFDKHLVKPVNFQEVEVLLKALLTPPPEGSVAPLP